MCAVGIISRKVSKQRDGSLPIVAGLRHTQQEFSSAAHRAKCQNVLSTPPQLVT